LIWYQFGADIFIVTAFASILMVFILFSWPPKSLISISCPDYTHLYHKP
jgi:hypothetical protein